MKCYAIANLGSTLDEEGLRLRARELADAGVDFLQLRGPELPARVLARAAALCAEMVRGSGTKLLINRRADVAAAVGADGVHLPAAGVPAEAVRRIDPRLIVGRSVHSLDDCHAAADQGADYVLFGPVFAPRSKPGEGRITVEDLLLAAAAGPPVFALGGISRDNMEALRGLPIAGIAAITLFMVDRPLRQVVEAVRGL